jgi:hypothetical protein
MARTSGREITVNRVRVRVLPDCRLDADNAARYMAAAPKHWRSGGCTVKVRPPIRSAAGSFTISTNWTPTSPRKAIKVNRPLGIPPPQDRRTRRGQAPGSTAMRNQRHGERMLKFRARGPPAGVLPGRDSRII